ncbi:MAG TPA: hypothetical protein PK737_03275, partial [Bacilli bacterium]|nr:hypothetical protein [Bacilli bacterium]
MQMVIKSPYTSLTEETESCLTFNWQKMRNMIIKKQPGPDCQMVRVLLNEAEYDKMDDSIIAYLNSIFLNNPHLGFHINVEDSKCFPLAKKIMAKINCNNKSIRLFPDSMLGDRTNLDLSDLNCLTIIPMQYAMWHRNLEAAKQNFLLFARKDNGDFDGRFPFSNDELSGQGGTDKFDSKYYDLRRMLEIKKAIFKKLFTEFRLNCTHNDLQKVLLVSAYLRRKIKYSIYDNKIIEVIDNSMDHQADFTLDRGQGVCEGIAETLMLFLNNPYINVDCRTLVGIAGDENEKGGHAWNVLKIKESRNYYLFDQTWRDGENDFDYTFFDFDPNRATSPGTNGQYRIGEKLPAGFLEEQYQEALLRENKGQQILAIKDIN